MLRMLIERCGSIGVYQLAGKMNVRHNGVAHRELMLDVFHDTAQYANNRAELYSSRYDFNDSLHDSVSSTHVP